MAREQRDWADALERLSRGDRVAFLEVSRLITGFLAGWRAYDFRDEWDDLVQEVILAAVEAHRSRKLRKKGAAVGYLRTTARYKFVDWLRRRKLEPLDPADGDERPTLEWPPPDTDSDTGFQIWDRVRALPEKQKQAVMLVYVEGRTYDEAAERSGIPLGSLKRYLREGVAALRESLADFVDLGGPIPASAATGEGETSASPDGKRGAGGKG